MKLYVFCTYCRDFTTDEVGQKKSMKKKILTVVKIWHDFSCSSGPRDLKYGLIIVIFGSGETSSLIKS